MPSARHVHTAKPSAKKARAPKAAEPRLSRQRKPEPLAADDWQRALRRQFGREQVFDLQNLGDAPVFTTFQVHNPQSGGRYRVAVRGGQPGDNTCTCADFATNDLGTCKHIEFVLHKLLARRGGKAALAQGLVAPYSELLLQHGSQRSVRLRLGSECPAALRKQAERLFDTTADWRLPPDHLDQLPRFITAAQTSGHELRVHEDAMAWVAQCRDTQHRQDQLAQRYPKGAADKGLNKLLKTRLYPYQAEGALFAARAGRVLLGDEMGLGKTVQAIAATELMARHFGVQRVLVVCPTSLKHQWQRELLRFAGREAQVLQGSRSARQQQYREDTFCKITNYETLGRDADLIDTWAPELLIIDEAQRVKNWHTIAARALRRIASPHVFVLTGTPLENRLEELIAIVQLVDQHRLGPTWRLLHEHQQVDDAGRVVGYQHLDRIGTTLAPILLRRRKAQVLTQLPERVDKTLFVPLTLQQRSFHDENGTTVRRIVTRWRKTGFLSDTDQRRLQCALQNMRMACNSTWLLDHETDFGTKADELMVVLEELLEDPAAKAVVFSQWLGTHEVVMRRLHARGWGHVLFHGGVPGDKRGALVDQFQHDPACRLFLSTDAGGVGLNLQHAAATVINMDLPWNPAVLEQRIGRVHRMGQARGVRVINFVAQGAIEEGMLSVLAFKKSLFSGVLDGGDSAVFMNGTRLSKFMESVDEVTGTMGTAEAEPPLQPDAAKATAMAVGLPHEPDPALDESTAATRAEPQAEPRADPWAPLLAAGLRLVNTLAAPAAADQPGFMETDPVTGQRFLKLPMPEPQAVEQLAEGLAALLSSLRR